MVTKKTVKPEKPFTPSKRWNGDPDLEAEFNRQLKDQQDAINNMKVKDWLNNRKGFKNRDKKQYKKDTKKARDEYRQKEIDKRTKDNMLENGGNYKKAKEDAIKSMKGEAALHNPDGVAGGKINDITGMGNSRANSSIGSQWENKGIAENIEGQIKNAYGIPPKTIDDIPADDLMNVDLF